MLPYQTTSRKEDGIVIVGLGGAGASILQRFSGSSAETLQDAGTGTAEPNDDDSFFFTGSGLIGKHGSMLVWKRVE